MCRFPLLLACWCIGAARAGDDPVDRWFSLNVINAATASVTVTGSRVELVASNGPNTALVGYFDPIEFKSGRPVTASCRILVPDGPTNATQQYRIGLYGVVTGTDPATRKQSDLRGFVLSGGNIGKIWELTFSERDRKEGGIIYAAGITELTRLKAEKTGGRGAEARLVLTLVKQTDGAVTADGFWGDTPFSFRCVPKAGELSHLIAIAVMRGRTTGKQLMTVSNVRVRAE